jgi:hypothetical protein
MAASDVRLAAMPPSWPSCCRSSATGWPATKCVDRLAGAVDAPGYKPAELRADLARFAFLLTGQDGEQVFGDEPGR